MGKRILFGHPDLISNLFAVLAPIMIADDVAL